jgi:hypothetical protein
MMNEQSKTNIGTIRIIGWCSILLSMIVILSELVSLVFYDPMNQFDQLLRTFPQLKVGAITAYTDIFQYGRLWSIYTIIFFIFVLVGAIQFVRLRELGRMLLEIACWIGILNACIDSILSYYIWKNLQAMMSFVIGSMGMPSRNLNPFGIFTIIGGFFIWVIPSIAMIVYLRRQKLKAIMQKI